MHNQITISKKAKRTNASIVVLAVLLLVVFMISLCVGRYPLNIFDASTYAGVQEMNVLLNVRLPRVLLALLVGAALSAAGAAFQGIFQNPLVSPSILGASQGAAFGAALAILLCVSSFFISVSAFAFSLVAVFLVLLISFSARGNRILVVVLAGVMIGALFQAGVSVAKLLADTGNQLPSITYWLMGSLADAKMSDVFFVLPPMIVAGVILLILRWKMNLLSMGDEEAQTMGINSRALRTIIILAATLLTASSVAVSGTIGWIGLVIPHLARMLTGPDFRKLLPASMLLGATFLLIVDDFARCVFAIEIPLGILTAFIGAPFFLYLILRKKKI